MVRLLETTNTGAAAGLVSFELWGWAAGDLVPSRRLARSLGSGEMLYVFDEALIRIATGIARLISEERRKHLIDAGSRGIQLRGDIEFGRAQRIRQPAC